MAKPSGARLHSGKDARELRVAVIGAGMAGILSAIKLRQAGISDFTVYEKADRLGGTWRENTDPGIACDVPSHLYSCSFAPNPSWSHRFSAGEEILRYLEGVAQECGIPKWVRFGEEVTRCAFTGGRWSIETASGGRDTADVVIAATGVLHHPRYPEISCLDSFEGSVFHSARWDHGLSLDGCRVGVVGTGSSSSSAPPSGSFPRRTLPTAWKSRRRSGGTPSVCAPFARRSRAASRRTSPTRSWTRSRPGSGPSRRRVAPTWSEA